MIHGRKKHPRHFYIRAETVNYTDRQIFNNHVRQPHPEYKKRHQVSPSLIVRRFAAWQGVWETHIIQNKNTPAKIACLAGKQMKFSCSPIYVAFTAREKFLFSQKNCALQWELNYISRQVLIKANPVNVFVRQGLLCELFTWRKF